MAAEFSFFLAVPTMAAATLYSLLFKDWKEAGVEYKGYEIILSNSQNLQSFIVGNIVAFVVAILAIKIFYWLFTKAWFSFIRLVQDHCGDYFASIDMAGSYWLV